MSVLIVVWEQFIRPLKYVHVYEQIVNIEKKKMSLEDSGGLATV